MAQHKPSARDLEDAHDRTLGDVIAHDLRILFVGINPGLYSAAIGHNFGRPGNRFWPALARSRLTPRQLAPSEEQLLPSYGLGITNIAARATARAETLTRDELIAGAQILRTKIARYRPRAVAVLGITAYRTAFARPKATLGRLPDDALPPAIGWVLPNPSGLNAHHPLPVLAELFRELAYAVP